MDRTPKITRRDLLQSALAAGGAVGMAAATPELASAEPQRGGGAGATGQGQGQGRGGGQMAGPPPLSRQFARWVANLKYEDLPPDVLDRARSLTLQGVTSALLGSKSAGSVETVKLVTEEETAAKNGATIWVDGRKVTRGAAAFVNADMLESGGKWDT